ncbi:MAG: hypothetical protein QGG54_21275, partial [Gammaproteobacteria bacterium]|nr:hypothetical protein [Gammaproteobacteria bacterium]
RDFNPGTIATTGNNNSEFREVMHVGVALQASGDSTPAALNRVTVSFADTNPLSAAQKIESAIEEQLGGEYRDGGALHIDVTAVADVYKLTANINSGAASSSVQIAANAEITQEVWDSTVAMINGGDYTDFGGALTEQIGTEYAAINKVYFKFSTTSTAGVSQTPELRIMSDELAGYTDTTKYPSRLFGNTLSIAAGEHGNDKFMLTIDGEEVEVDLDGDFASSTAQRIDTLVDEVEKLTVNAASSTAAVNAEITRMGITNERSYYYTAVDADHLMSTGSSSVGSITFSGNSTVASNHWG